jgi:hypothetical protein
MKKQDERGSVINQGKRRACPLRTLGRSAIYPRVLILVV